MLPQNSFFHTHKIKLRALVFLSTLPLLGVVTAFGIMPQANQVTDIQRTIVASLDLPPVSPSKTEEPVFWHSAIIQRGDTISELLRRLDVQDVAADNFLRRTANLSSLRQLRPGRTVQAQTSADGRLLTLSYTDNKGKQVKVTRSGDAFTVNLLPAQAERRVFAQSGEIVSSLFAATDSANIPDSVAVQLAEIFGGVIDFHRDLRRGDQFRIVYEQLYLNGDATSNTRILAAEFVNRGRVLQAFYFQNNGGGGDYFSADGQSLRKAFLRSPIKFSRVSSGFTMARFHPILKRWRAHKGVDYAAPAGTEVRTTADGVVRFVGKQRGYGNVVIIDHPGNFQTVYGHLSRFAKLQRGQRVSQGEVIGYVGQTGLATGPHLHYEFKVNGVQRDPLKIALPEGKPIDEAQRPAFIAATERLRTQLALLRPTRIALLD